MRRRGCQARLQLEAHRLVLLRALVKLLGLAQIESPSSLALRLLPAFPARGVEAPRLLLLRALVMLLGGLLTELRVPQTALARLPWHGGGLSALQSEATPGR